MHEVVRFVTKHGYSVLFGAVFAHQLGVPVPGPLFLVAAGALAAAGKLGLDSPFSLWPWPPVSWVTGRGTKLAGDGATGSCISFTVSRMTLRPTIAERKRCLARTDRRYSSSPSSSPDWTR